MMPLTRNATGTVRDRIQADPAFRTALMTEALNAFLGGDVDTRKAVLRDYVKATVGFEGLAERTGRPLKKLMRMFSLAGNPAADSLFSVISTLQRDFGASFEV